jgi:hypothetical protein
VNSLQFTVNSSREEKRDGNTEFTEIGTQRAQRTERRKEKGMGNAEALRSQRGRREEEEDEKRVCGLRSEEPTLRKQGWPPSSSFGCRRWEDDPRPR